MKMSSRSLILGLGLSLAGAAWAATPNGRGMVPRDQPSPTATQPELLKLNISYHGGPVMTDPNGANVYYIWYGNWAGDTTPEILSRMMGGVTGSAWYNINTTYYGGSKANPTYVTNKVKLAGSVADAYSQGNALSDAQIQQVVTDSIGSGRLPKDANGVYFVLTSPDVTATSGFCTAYCGWHNHASILGSDIKYSFVGNASAQCPNSCIADQALTASPNGNPGADGMASVLMHELVETISDPDLNAWYDLIGQENADKCAWKFGKTKVAPNGGIYNVSFGKGKYLIQQNWDASQQKCLSGL